MRHPDSRFRCVSLLILLSTSMMLAACGNRPTAIPGPTTPAPTLGLQTLPPTWTPTATYTPAPTRTATQTPTPVPTLSVEAICSTFNLLMKPDPKNEILMTGQAIFAWKGVPQGMPMHIYVHPRGSKQGVLLDVPIPGDGILPLPATALPDARHFEWSAWITHPQSGNICVQQGTFIRQLIFTF